MKFAAIDIGSNAVRLLIENVYETAKGPVFHKDSLLRIPVRLGEDAFLDGAISEEKIEMLVKAMAAMRNIMEIHKVTSVKIAATSAMRDAANSKEIVHRVYKETGLMIEVISGDSEGKTILQGPMEQIGLNPMQHYLYIDVGGGSTELAFISKGELAVNHSFNIGTLRLLNDQVSDSDWKQMLEWIKKNKNYNFELSAIGVGGNINHVMKHYGKAGRPYLGISILKRVMIYIDGLSMGERVRTLGLKPDRADVIVPALKIYINVMKWSGIDKIYVPKQGLSDGLISQAYADWKQKTSV